ncbi:hypothetical protein ACHAWU_009307 [Discostella pseudostelligera]|uniref:Uncharacterized protein n=1 Tax=Discostella pseudostelligera TaxID=259834 RepID=A0ABD3MAF2_9STRA
MAIVHRHPAADDLLLEFEDSAVTTMALSHLSLDNMMMPGMIKSPSLGSVSTDCDSDSLSSGVRSPSSSPLYNLASSPRSIFDTYWATSSPSSSLPSTSMRKKRVTVTTSRSNKSTALGEDAAKDEEVLARLQATLRLPSDDENDQTDDIEECSGTTTSTPGDSMVHQSSSLDDTLVDYQAAMATSTRRHSTRTTRRQILPSPPPPPSPNTAAVSPSICTPPSSTPLIILPQHILPCSQAALPTPLWWFGMRPWSSTSALQHSVKREPSQSCLRKSRYSFSGTISPSPSCNSECSKPGEDEEEHLHNRPSVSFYSQVSVLEFTVPQHEKRSQEGWSKYFV